MPLSYVCPACGKHHRQIDKRLLGKKMQCVCGQIVRLGGRPYRQALREMRRGLEAAGGTAGDASGSPETGADAPADHRSDAQNIEKGGSTEDDAASVTHHTRFFASQRGERPEEMGDMRRGRSVFRPPGSPAEPPSHLPSEESIDASRILDLTPIDESTGSFPELPPIDSQAGQFDLAPPGAEFRVLPDTHDSPASLRAAAAVASGRSAGAGAPADSPGPRSPAASRPPQTPVPRVTFQVWLTGLAAAVGLVSIVSGYGWARQLQDLATVSSQANLTRLLFELRALLGVLLVVVGLIVVVGELRQVRGPGGGRKTTWPYRLLIGACLGTVLVEVLLVLFWSYSALPGIYPVTLAGFAWVLALIVVPASAAVTWLVALQGTQRETWRRS